MKHWTIGAVIVLSACGVLPDRSDELQDLKAEEAQARAALDMAQATPDASDDVAAAARLDKAEDALGDFETKVVRDKIGLVTSVVSAIPGVGPIAAGIGSVAALLAPIGVALSKRQRKHWKDAIVATSKGRLPTAARSVGKAYGLAHSNEASKEAANG